MEKYFVAMCYYKDGTRLRRQGETREQALEKLNEVRQVTIRFYKRNGVDYGEHGKLLTTDDEHGEIEKITITEWQKVKTEIIEN